MGMIQIDMEMPATCYDCPFCYDCCSCCLVENSEFDFEICDEQRMSYCPLKEVPDNGGWINVKDRLPEEHDSIFAGHTHLSKYMWCKESDNVNVYVEFPDGTGRVTEGRLQDGKWWTRLSPVLNPVVTHWMPLPKPPKEET